MKKHVNYVHFSPRHSSPGTWTSGGLSDTNVYISPSEQSYLYLFSLTVLAMTKANTTTKTAKTSKTAQGSGRRSKISSKANAIVVPTAVDPTGAVTSSAGVSPGASAEASAGVPAKRGIQPTRPLHIRYCEKKILLGIQRHKLRRLRAREAEIADGLEKATTQVDKLQLQLDRYSQKMSADDVHLQRLRRFVRFVGTLEGATNISEKDFQAYADEWNVVAGVRTLSELTQDKISKIHTRVSLYLQPEMSD